MHTGSVTNTGRKIILNDVVVTVAPDATPSVVTPEPTPAPTENYTEYLQTINDNIVQASRNNEQLQLVTIAGIFFLVGAVTIYALLSKFGR